MVNQQCNFPRGKGLGGSSLINYMIYNRGNKRDFDFWAKAGNVGWSYRDVLPYFKKSEKSRMKKKFDSRYHNQNGELSVEYVKYKTKLAQAYVGANKYLGYPEIDYNGVSQNGVAYMQANTLHGTRHTAAKAFLQPIRKTRKNLHILTQARVTKILIDPRSKTAYGVKYVKNRKEYTVIANKEVILSAGAFNSPQLLMLSGIGPKKHLKKIGVTLLKDLPVGRNLLDHVNVFAPTFRLNTTSLSVRSSELLRSPIFPEYLLGRGPLTIIGGVEVLTFMKTKRSRDPADHPDIELIFIPGSLSSDEGSGLKSGMRISDETYNAVYKQLENIDTWSVLIMLFRPKSVGYLELKDSNPFHWPRIYHNYFDEPEDIEHILEGIREVIRISDTPQMQKYGSTLHDVPLPHCAHLQFNSDNYWRCAIRTITGTTYHQLGTCKMGPWNDPTSVVSPELKVHGVNRLRVVDTSIIPYAPTGHPNALSYMIGEKAADMIKYEHFYDYY